MNVSEILKRKPRRSQKAASAFTPEQAAANLELLLQELAGLETSAALYFQDFTVPGKGGVHAVRRCWLLPGVEGLQDLTPERVDFVLKHLGWFRKQIQEVEIRRNELDNDEIPWL